MKRWKGIWIIAVSILHTIFAIVSYGAVYKKMINDGFIDSLNSVHSSAFFKSIDASVKLEHS